jgi:uncharacterized lipoprotein YajG
MKYFESFVKIDQRASLRYKVPMHFLFKILFGMMFPALCFFYPNGLRAQETETVVLQVPAGFYSRLCPTPVWQGVRVQWLGVTDQRGNPAVGLESKKHGKDPVAVTVSPPLAATFEGALRGLLSACGMNFVDPPQEVDWRMSAVIQEFHSGVEKGIIMGKGQAKSRVELFAESARRKLSASAGYEVEFKKTRKKSLQRLTETLNEIFQKTLEQVVKSPQLREMGNLP